MYLAFLIFHFGTLINSYTNFFFAITEKMQNSAYLYIFMQKQVFQSSSYQKNYNSKEKCV